MSSDAQPGPSQTLASDTGNGNGGDSSGVDQGGTRTGSDTLGSGETSGVDGTAASTSRTGGTYTEYKEKCNLVFENIITGKIDPPAGYVQLCATGISQDEANRLMGLVLAELDRRRNRDESEHDGSDGGQDDAIGEASANPDARQSEHHVENEPPVVPTVQSDIQRIFDSAPWATTLSRKLDYATRPSNRPPRARDNVGPLADVDFTTSVSDRGIPTTVLLAAPHLTSMLLASDERDPILSATWKIRNALTSEKCIEHVVAILQQQDLRDPLPVSIWRDIVNDKYVNFEKLFASTVPGFDHNDEPKILAGEYAVIKKSDVSRKKPVLSESDWTRVFDAWANGVLLLYKHRTDELTSYRDFVIELFRALPNEPSRAIRVDADVRDRYGKSPFRLDDRNIFNSFSFTRLLSKDLPSSQSPDRMSSKRPAPQGSTNRVSQKRAAVICLNWNDGRCVDPCANRRKHGECSECGERHRASELLACKTSFDSKKGSRRTDSKIVS